MGKASTQEAERHYFEMFRNDYDLPAGVVTYGDKPDVVVRGEKTIGFELTNFFLEAGNLPQSEQVQSRARDKVVASAHNQYLADTARKVEFTFGFDQRHPILDPERLSRDMVALAKRADRFETGQLDIDLFEEIPELSYVYINAKEYDDAKWRIAQVHSVPLMSLDGLRRIIEDKETKSKQYRACDAYWLLIIVDFMDPAQDQEIDVRGFSEITSKVFDNILVYKPQFKRIIETKRHPGGRA